MSCMCFPFKVWIVNPRIFVWGQNLTNCCNYLFCNCFLLFKSAVRRNTSTSKATDGETEKVVAACTKQRRRQKGEDQTQQGKGG
jgi:hypothetical protein